MDTVWGIPYSFGPDSFVEPGVNALSWSSHFFHGKFPDLFECPRGILLELYSMDVHVNVDGVFSGHYLIDFRTVLLLATFFLWDPGWKAGDPLCFNSHVYISYVKPFLISF